MFGGDNVCLAAGQRPCLLSCQMLAGHPTFCTAPPQQRAFTLELCKRLIGEVVQSQKRPLLTRAFSRLKAPTSAPSRGLLHDYKTLRNLLTKLQYLPGESWPGRWPGGPAWP